jgi:hypothetical protein
MCCRMMLARLRSAVPLACRYEVTVQKSKRSLAWELSLAVLASILLGFGTLFLLLWAGVWV